MIDPSGQNLDRPAHVCVVGSGPVGLKLALDLADRGLEVILIESGMVRPDPVRQALCDAELLDERRHAPMALSTRRAFGGTANIWAGRCVPFDDFDFADRPGMPQTRWPITAADVAPWYESACQFLDCGPPVFESHWQGTRSLGKHGLVLDRIERWCGQPKIHLIHGARALKHPHLTVAFGVTALSVAVDPVDGRATHLVVATEKGRCDIQARAIVLAAGGVETTRLLLVSRAGSGMFAGADGPLGRYYMGHISGSIADIVFEQPGDDALFDYTLDEHGRYVRRRITLKACTLIANAFPNIVAWPEVPPIHDARHGSGILSLAYLALATPLLGSRLSPEAIRRRKLASRPVDFKRHLLNIAGDLAGSLASAWQFLSERYVSDVRLPGFYVHSPDRRYDFYFHGEHSPNSSSRVLLGQTRDELNQPRVKIDLRFRKEDALAVLRAHDHLAKALERNGIAHIRHRLPERERVAGIFAQASAGLHQIGTARMSEDANNGVVNRNCRVHGSPNLFLAGSAVFPSSGQANPTLLAVALASRLAIHLDSEFQQLPPC